MKIPLGVIKMLIALDMTKYAQCTQTQREKYKDMPNIYKCRLKATNEGAGIHENCSKHAVRI